MRVGGVPLLAARCIRLIMAIAREPGTRSKVGVVARQENVDPVGSCVGIRGVRIQNIVNELQGEKIDVIEWSPDQAQFVAAAGTAVAGRYRHRRNACGYCAGD